MNDNNERHGFGTYNVIFAGKYEGQWRNGFKHGAGISYYKNGNIQYEGAWEGGEPHGPGTVYNMEGEVRYKGQWKCGKSANGVYMEKYKHL